MDRNTRASVKTKRKRASWNQGHLLSPIARWDALAPACLPGGKDVAFVLQKPMPGGGKMAYGALLLALLLLALPAGPGRSADGGLQNSSFTQGSNNSPTGWVLSGCQGNWEPGRVTVIGSGTDSGFWRSQTFSPVAGKRYRLSFRLSGSGTGGCAISGLDCANRDFAVSAYSTPHSFVFRAPEGHPDAFLRLGQWQVRGQVAFSNADLREAIPVYRHEAGLELGAGERVQGDRYTFEAPLSGDGSNDSRPLLRTTAGFNSDRWTFVDGQEVVYRHALPGAMLVAAEVTVRVGYYTGGACAVEASANARNWLTIGRIDSVASQTFAVPADLFPAPQLFVRLRAERTATSDAGTPDLQVAGYAFSARLNRRFSAAVGTTRYLCVNTAAPRLGVEVVDLGALVPGGDNRVHIRLTGATVGAVATVSVTEPGSARAKTYRAALLRQGGTSSARIPYEVRRAGDGQLLVSVRVGRRTLWSASTEYRISLLHAADYGYRLPSSGNVALWWCEATYKVSRDRPVPSTSRPEVTIEAARGEYEPAQVVIRPTKPLNGLAVSISDLVSKAGRIPSSEVELRRVAYVHVNTPTDSYGESGDWPDPLPPIRGPLNVSASANQPLWITVHVPRDAKAATYRGKLQLSSGRWRQTVPVAVRVWDYTLPRSPRITSAFGFSVGLLKRYHNLATDAELAQVMDLYMRDFARHRISPYEPHALAPIKVAVRDGHVHLDFTEFDKAAARYLDGLGFTTIRIGLEGMGGGTFYSRSPGVFGGYQQGTPEYERLMGEYLRALQDHLEEKGWLPKAYTYWFDEPDEKDYEFVREGMSLIHRYAPKLARMLTEQPEPALRDSVDIWCPILDAYRPDACHAEQQRGKRVWWYVCTGPKGPYTTLFIDHPAVNMRMWVWLAYKYGVNGLLVWDTNYWTSDTAFPPPALQNPWEDPMSYVSGYGTPAGAKLGWGNGDGRFLYPPEGYADGRKRIEGPVDSIRWEMLRDGLEDADSLFVLADAVRSARAAGAPLSLISEAEALVAIPQSIAAGLTEFTRDPQPMYKHRRAVSRMIERLARWREGRNGQ